MPEPTDVMDEIATVVSGVSGISRVGRSRRRPDPGRGHTQAEILWAGDTPSTFGMSRTHGRTRHDLPIAIRVMTTKDDDHLAKTAYAVFDAVYAATIDGVTILEPGEMDEPEVLDENSPFIFTEINFTAKFRRT